jgi:sugar phosphate isomerase/epimerase
MVMGLDVGLQTYSVRNSFQHDSIGTLEAIAEAGYKNLQLTRVAATAAGVTHVAGTMSAAELKQRLDGLGMRVVSLHAGVNEQTDWDRLLAFNHELGSSSIIVPIAFYTDRASVLDYAHTLNRYGERCRKQGVDFQYHNHFQEFQVVDGQTIMDLLLEHTDKDLVKFELDTYWAARGGVDPAAWLRKLGDRCDIVHQKDIPTTAQPRDWFDHFGHDTHITLQMMYETQQPEQFTEIGEGTMDIPALIATMRQTGVWYILVEQDASARSELESIRVSYQNIVKLLGVA